MEGLGRAFTAFPAIQRVAFAGLVAYRAEMIIWVLSATLPLVMLALWNAAAAGGPVGDYGQVEFARYFTVNLVVRQITGAWIVWELNWAIRKGELSPRLLRPMNPLVFNFAETMAALPFRSMVVVPLVAALLLWRPEIAFRPGVPALLAFVPSVALAFACAWLTQAIFGMFAFWFEQSMGFWTAYFALWSLCGGYFVPLDLFPEGFVGAVKLLPFYATLGAPIDVLLGRAGIETVGLQVAWLLALAALARLCWSRGIRRYGAVGA